MNTQKIRASAFILIALSAVYWVYYDEVVEKRPATREEVLAPVDAFSAPEDEKAASLRVLGRTRSSAVSTTTVEVAGCRAEPYSITAIYGEKVVFVNSGAVAHTLSFIDGSRREVPPGGWATVSTLDMVKGEKKPRSFVAASYGCDDLRPAGVVNLTD